MRADEHVPSSKFETSTPKARLKLEDEKELMNARPVIVGRNTAKHQNL